MICNSLNLTTMYATQPKKENRFVLFAKFFVLPVLSIVVIVLVINHFQTYIEMDDMMQTTETSVNNIENKTEISPKISSISKGMDKK